MGGSKRRVMVPPRPKLTMPLAPSVVSARPSAFLAHLFAVMALLAGMAAAGMPVHAADGYLSRLIRQGFKVAICEQMEDPAAAKKRGSKAVVRRDVVRVEVPAVGLEGEDEADQVHHQRQHPEERHHLPDVH